MLLRWFLTSQSGSERATATAKYILPHKMAEIFQWFKCSYNDLFLSLHAIPWQREPVIRGNQVGAWLPALRMFQQMPLWRLVATETTYSAVISVARWASGLAGAGRDIREEVTTSQKVCLWSSLIFHKDWYSLIHLTGFPGFNSAGSSLNSTGGQKWWLRVKERMPDWRELLSISMIRGGGKHPRLVLVVVVVTARYYYYY